MLCCTFKFVSVIFTNSPLATLHSRRLRLSRRSHYYNLVSFAGLQICKCLVLQFQHSHVMEQYISEQCERLLHPRSWITETWRWIWTYGKGSISMCLTTTVGRLYHILTRAQQCLPSVQVTTTTGSTPATINGHHWRLGRSAGSGVPHRFLVHTYTSTSVDSHHHHLPALIAAATVLPASAY